MARTIRLESDLYPEMCKWLETRLNNIYKGKDCRIIVEDTSQVAIDKILEKYNIVQYYPQTVGIGIQIDVLGMVIFKHSADIFFIEAKRGDFTLRDLGQLLIYCKLCNPTDAWLLTPGGFGTLNKIIISQGRRDLLDFGSGKTIKSIKIAKWDKNSKSIDYSSIIPKY